jgi:type IV fimbrial biogenesis protein FimT
MRNQHGLTLVELAVTVAIAAVGLALALPAFHGVQQRTRAATARHSVTSALMTARSSAIMRRQPVTACPSADGIRCSGGRDWSQGWIVYHDPHRHPQPPSSTHVLRRFDALSPSLSMTSTVGRTLVRYQPDGRASGTNLSLRLCSSRDRQLLATVIVNNAGRARSETPSRSTPCP